MIRGGVRVVLIREVVYRAGLMREDVREGYWV